MDQIKKQQGEQIVMSMEKYVGNGIEMKVDRKINTGLFSKGFSSDTLSRLTRIDKLDTVVALRSKYG